MIYVTNPVPYHLDMCIAVSPLTCMPTSYPAYSITYQGASIEDRFCILNASQTSFLPTSIPYHEPCSDKPMNAR